MTGVQVVETLGILNAIQMSLYELEILPHQAAIFSGIGCSGKNPLISLIHLEYTHYMAESCPSLKGAKLANPNLKNSGCWW